MLVEAHLKSPLRSLGKYTQQTTCDSAYLDSNLGWAVWVPKEKS